MGQLLPENSTLARRLRRAAQGGALPHAIIFSGSGDRMAAARFAAAAMECQAEGGRPCLQCRQCRKVMEDIHPDVQTVQDPDHRELPVDLLRSLRQDAYIRPNDGAAKVYIFPDCDALNQRDQNVLLKLVEEGPPYAAFLFCAETAATLLPTIRSRCVELRLEGQDAALEENEAAAELCRVLARRDPLALAAHLTGLENRRMKREQLLAMMEGAWQASADALLAVCGRSGSCGEGAEALRSVFDRRQLQALTDLFRRYCSECQYNVGVGHVLGALNAELTDILTL